MTVHDSAAILLSMPRLSRKVVIVGDEGVGKTSFVIRFTVSMSTLPLTSHDPPHSFLCSSHVHMTILVACQIDVYGP